MSVNDSESPSATDDSKVTIVKAVKDGNFTKLSDVDALRLLEKEFSSELERLKNAEGTIEGSSGKTVGDLEDGPRKGLSPSRLLYNDEDFEEPNRTLVSFLALKWVMSRNYEAFTKNQPPGPKLKEDSFNRLCDLAHETLKSPDLLLALIVAIIIGDVGKDPKLLDEVRAKDQRPINDENHDEVVYTAALNGMLPSLNLLKDDLRNDVLAGLKVGSKLNIPQLAQGENVPGNLTVIKQLRNKRRAFDIKYLEILFDVAGSGGQDDSRGAARMIEPVYQGYVTSREALLALVENPIPYREAYDTILTKRADIIQAAGFRRLSVDNPEERALLRIMAMGRAATKIQAETFEAAFKSLNRETRNRLVDGLNVDGSNDGEAILPYYMPAILAESIKNVQNHAGNQRKSPRSPDKPDKKPDKKQVNAVTSCLRFLTRVYGGSKPIPGELGRITERNLSFAQRTIKSEEFYKNPKVLDSIPLPWET